MSKLITKEQASSIANAVIDKVKAKGYAVASELGDLATKDEVAKTDLATALANEIDAKLDAADILSYTVKKQTTAETGYSATYQLFSVSADATPVETPVGAKINIPKDLVVESGTVETVETADVPYQGAVVGDKYIDLVIANADDEHIYIPVNDLVDVYTEGNGIDISNNSIAIRVDNSNANGLSVGANGLALGLATPSVNGVGGTAGALSAADKEKLDNADMTAYTQGNGISISNHEISANVVAANGLSVGANGIAMATVTASTSGVGGSAGAMTATDKEKLDGLEIATSAEIEAVIENLDDLDD